MASQWEIIDLLEHNKDKWLSAQEIKEILGTHKNTIGKKIRQIGKHMSNVVVIYFDRQNKHKLKINCQSTHGIAVIYTTKTEDAQKLKKELNHLRPY